MNTTNQASTELAPRQVIQKPHQTLAETLADRVISLLQNQDLTVLEYTASSEYYQRERLKLKIGHQELILDLANR